MPEVVLYPGAVTIHDSGNPDSNPTLFGAPPQWADASDASGALVNVARRPSGTRLYVDRAYATLDVLQVPATAVTAIHAEMRASATSSPSLPESRPNPRAGVSLYTGAYSPGSATNTYVNEFETITSAAEIGSWHIHDDGTPRDYSCPLGTLDSTLLTAAIALTEGCVIEAVRLAEDEETADHALTVYELAVVVTYNLSPRRAAPLRVLQRGNDGLGITGGRRVLGTRTIQSSNRRGSAIR